MARIGRVTRRSAWPAYAIAAYVGLFVVVVAVLWVVSHVIGDEPLDDTAWIIAAATALRAVTIVIALAAVRAWGERLPGSLLTAALWGCASAQLVYPVAELVAKLAILTGLIDVSTGGVADMTATGWFNLAAVWLVFGVPGALFVMLARTVRRRRATGRRWAVAGGVAGVGFLAAIGAAIG